MNHQRKVALEIGINMLFIIMIIGMVVVSSDYDFVKGKLIGARTFPLLVGGIMSVFALVNILNALRKKAEMEESQVQEEVEEQISGRFNGWLRTYRVGAAIGLMVIYYFLLLFVGFIAATLLFLPAMLYIVEYRKVTHVALVTVIGVAFLYIAFKILLGVPLPKSIIF